MANSDSLITSRRYGELCDLSDYPDDHIGVVPIYKPAGRARGRIFEFHGPGGSWRTTWCQDVAPALESPDHATAGTNRRQKSIFWLQDFLPKGFPHCAIYSIGHEDRWYEDRSYREGLIWHWIEAHLKSTPLNERAPIVFVAHGFGGVILKQVVQHLWGSKGSPSSCTPQLDQLKGVIFLATPHHFSHKPSRYSSFFPEDVRTEFSGFNSYQSEKVVTNLKELPELVKSNHLKIFSVHEASPPQILPRYDTLLGGLPADSEKIIDGAASHFALSKFQDYNEPRFQEICQCLISVFGDLISGNIDWDVTLFHIRRQRPFGTFLNVSRDHFVGDYDSRFLPLSNLRPGLRDNWVHIPFNNAILMTRAMKTMSPSYISSHGISESLGPFLKAQSDFPHSRLILPKHEFFQPVLKPLSMLPDMEGYETRINYVRIFLPYIHWDTVTGARDYNSDVHHAYESLNGVNQNPKIPTLADLLKQNFRDYHPRRTLDQFYYSRIKDTSKRDADQVVSRQTKMNKDPKMIMVDQLWLCLWIVESKEIANSETESWEYAHSAVLTSFPWTSYARSNKDTPDLYHIADVRQAVLSKLEGSDYSSFRASELAASILSTALFGTLSIREHLSLEFLELFREAIGDVAVKYDDLYRKFDKSMHQGSEPIDVEQRREAVRQGLQIADIIDELHILEQLLVTQRDVLTKAYHDIKNVECLKSLRNEMGDIMEKISTHYLFQIDWMTKDSVRVQKGLFDLLDLQQKEENINKAQDNIHEAQRLNQQALFTAKQALSAQVQADATEAQSQILFLFTVVTIIFLPLSFFTSYFGMNIDNGSGSTVNYTRSHVNNVMGGSSGPIIGILLIGAVVWYLVSKKRSQHERTRELIRLQDESFLPERLILPADPEYKRMERMRQKMAMTTAKAAAERNGDEDVRGLRGRRTKPEDHAV